MENFFKENLKFLRESKHMSQNKLSQLTNVSQATINRWESGENVPTIDNVIDVMVALKVPTNEIGNFLGKDLSKVNDTSLMPSNDDEYKKIFMEKGLMDENEKIDENKLNELIKIADAIKKINEKKD